MGFLLLIHEQQVKKMTAGQLLAVNLTGIYKGALNPGSLTQLLVIV